MSAGRFLILLKTNSNNYAITVPEIFRTFVFRPPANYVLWTVFLVFFNLGVQVNGWFIVTIWGFMVWKWGFLLFWFARGYLLGLHEEIGTLLAVNSDEYS